MNKKILIVEDDVDWQEIFRRGLNLFPFLEIIQVFSIEDARKAFADNPDLSIIAVDACVPGKTLNTMDIVKDFRISFKGPMIAISSRDDFNEMLISAGCNHKSEKHLLTGKIRQVLDS